MAFNPQTGKFEGGLTIGNGNTGNSWSGLLNFGPSGNVEIGSPSSALSVSSADVDSLYENNRIWAEEQAQKQMDFQTAANKIAMDFSAEQADKERAFQTEMANSAYQRAVLDLKKAGLNPILAYSQGGAAVPSVNTASGVASAGSKASMSDTGYNAAKLALDQRKFEVNSALDALRLFFSFAK